MFHNVSSKCNIEKIIFRWTFSLCDIIGSQIKSLWAKICNFYQHQEKLLWLWHGRQWWSLVWKRLSSLPQLQCRQSWPFQSSHYLFLFLSCGIIILTMYHRLQRYGEPKYLPIDEKHPTGGCTNPYGKTKFFMEEIMKVISIYPSEEMINDD